MRGYGFIDKEEDELEFTSTEEANLIELSCGTL